MVAVTAFRASLILIKTYQIGKLGVFLSIQRNDRELPKPVSNRETKPNCAI